MALPANTGTLHRHLSGWIVSFLAHGIAAGVMMLLAIGRHTPPSEPFHWNVSMVAPGPAQTAQPDSSSSQPVAQQTSTAPSAQPVAKPEPVSTPLPDPTPAPVRVTETPAMKQAPAPAEPTPVVPPQPAEAPPVVTARSTPAPQPAPAAPAEPQHSTPAALEAKAPAATTSTPSAPSSTSAKRDYGWLNESLWERLRQLHRYPTTARLNQWEGVVELRMVIKEDGSITDLQIVKSSGHDALDQDALDLIRRASPFKLKQSLGQPQVPIKIPISYKLEQ